MRIKVVITETLTRVFECASLDHEAGMDYPSLYLYKNKNHEDLIATIPRYLYWEDITNQPESASLGLTAGSLDEPIELVIDQPETISS